MRSRGLVVAIAVVLAVAAAAAVILYTQGIKDDAVQGSGLTPVIVATRDIRANEALDPLLAEGNVFIQIRVPGDALVQGAVTDLQDLTGASTTSAILANEQIPLERLSSGEGPLGGNLGISKGNVAVSVALDAPQGGVGNIQVGDNVSIFATYQGVSVLSGNLRQLLTQPTAPTGAKREVPDFTVTLVPTVRVLRIQNPQVSDETGQSEGGVIQITLDLEPEDAQNLVFAQENARVWLGLLPPNEEGTQPKAATVPLELLIGAKLG